jgi:hypothetical protein
MKALLLMAMLIPMTAMATKLEHVPPPVPSTAESTSSSNSHSDSNASSSSDASGGDSSLNQTIKSSKLAPTVFSSGTNNNVPCHGEWHAGASVLVGGLSFGRDRKDKDCLLKTAADDQYTRGHFQAAARLYCKIQYYAEALGKDCVAMLSEPPAETPASVTDASDVATKADLEEVKNTMYETMDRMWRTGVGK